MMPDLRSFLVRRSRLLAGLVAVLLVLALCSCPTTEERQAQAEPPAEIEVTTAAEDPYVEPRRRMVAQIRDGYGLEDEAVLAALQAVPRHRFVPENAWSAAYGDHPLRIGHEQTISQPYIVAAMTSAAGIDRNSKVLEIGTGSGYQAAVLAEIAAEVFSIEIVEPLGERAAKLLRELGYDQLRLRIGDGYRGWPEEAPFDAIIVTAAPDHVPEPLKQQLKVGGRLVMPVGGWNQQLIVITRTEGGFEQERLMGVRFVPMTGEAQQR